MMMRRDARRVLLFVGAFLYVGLFGTILPAEFPGVRIAGQLLFGIPLTAWAVLRLGRSRTALDAPVMVCLVIFAVVAYLGRDVQGSLEMLGGALAWALLYWMMTDIRSPGDRASVAFGAIGALTAWLIIFAIWWTAEKVTWVVEGGGMPNLVESTQTLIWLTTNVVPVMTLLGLGFAGYLTRGPGTRVLLLVLSASIVAIPMSGGRAGWLGLATGGIVLLGIEFGWSRIRFGRAQLFSGLVVTTAAGVLLFTIGRRTLDTVGLTSRFPLWNEALSIAALNPLAGGGPSTYSWLRLEHVPDYATPIGAVLAHNVVLQTAADGGLLLLFGLATIVAGLAVHAFRRRNQLTSTDRRTLAVLIGFAVVCLLDDHSSLPAVAAMIVTLTAWLVSPSGEPPAPPWRGQRVFMLLMVTALAAASLPAVARVDIARSEAQAAREAILSGDLETAMSGFDRAIATYPARANYHLSAGLTAALSGQPTVAIQHYRTAAELAPGDARAWGALSALSSNERERLTSAGKAARAGSADPHSYYVYGRLLAEAGEIAEARMAIARAIVRLPSLATELSTDANDPLNRNSVLDVVLANNDALSAEARTYRPKVLWDLMLAGILPAEDLPPAWKSVRALQAGDLLGAEAAIADAISTDSLTIWTWLQEAAVAAQNCESERHQSAIRLADLVPGGRPRVPDGLVYASADLAYREQGLGKYQPIPSPFGIGLLQWPDAYLPEPPDCDAR